MSKWIPVSALPEVGREVLAHVGPSYLGGVLVLEYSKYNGLLAWRCWDQDIWEPDYWMLLPEPPKETKEDE